jgi:hypothetical protein
MREEAGRHFGCFMSVKEYSMIVGGITNTSPSSVQGVQDLLTKPRKDLQSIQKDLNSCDLPAAQKDFADFQKDISSLLNASPATPNGLQKAASDFKALQSDLDSGDLQASQKDFSTLLQDLQSAGARKHHKHHQPESSNAVMAAYAAFSKPGTSGTNLNATA